MYNLTAVEAAETFPQIATATNDLTGSLLAIAFLLIIAVLVMIVFKNNDMRTVFIGDSLLITVLAIILWAGDFVAWKVIVLPSVCLIGGLIFYFATQD